MVILKNIRYNCVVKIVIVRDWNIMNINYTQVIKKQTQIIALSVFVMVIGILGVSYALFMKVDQSEEQTVQSGSLIMQLSAYDGSTVITDNNTPIDDNEGLLSKGYSFSVTNNGTLPITYYIALYDNPDDTSTNKVNYDYIKVSLDNGTPFTLGSITSKDSAGRYILKQDISLAPDKYDTHNIKIWLDEDTPESEIGKTISLKIYAYGEVCEDGECNGGTLPPVKKIISQLDTTGKCPTVNEDGSVSVTGVEATDGYLCKAKDDYGDSYYYRGNVTNNYVKFADKYWRIVRINGDGTVRVIYDGTSSHANGESSSDRQIGTSAFNRSYNDNAYVGYMYGATGASTYATAHANTNDSTIKAYIDNWYKANILGTANEEYLADNIFCNDRSISSNKPSSSFNNLGYGANATAYRWYYFANSSYNNKMMLTCPQQNDAFTVSDTTNGNGALTYPIGLLSTDEVVLAGGWSDSNSGYYLYSGQVWWASSPRDFNGLIALMRYVDSDGGADFRYSVEYSFGVRPVFNLKAEVLTYGNGTMNNPYRLTENIDSTTSSGSGSSAGGSASSGVGTDSTEDITVEPGTGGSGGSGGSDGPQIQ